jgi:hypothetical protein
VDKLVIDDPDRKFGITPTTRLHVNQETGGVGFGTPSGKIEFLNISEANQEIITVHAEYQNLSKERKREIILDLMHHLTNELQGGDSK